MGEDLYMNVQQSTFRPQFIFTQGNYVSHLDSVMYADTIFDNPISIVETHPYIDHESQWHLYNYFGYYFRI